jgi:hypothetical protein
MLKRCVCATSEPISVCPMLKHWRVTKLLLRERPNSIKQQMKPNDAHNICGEPKPYDAGTG